MPIGSKIPPQLLQLNGQHIERVSSYVLQGLHVTDTLKWNVNFVVIVLQGGTTCPFPSPAQTWFDLII